MAHIDVAWRLLNAAIMQAKAQLDAAGIAYSESDGYPPRGRGLFGLCAMERWLNGEKLWLAHCEVKIGLDGDAAVTTRFADHVVSAMLQQPGPSAPPLPPRPPVSPARLDHRQLHRTRAGSSGRRVASVARAARALDPDPHPHPRAAATRAWPVPVDHHAAGGEHRVALAAFGHRHRPRAAGALGSELGAAAELERPCPAGDSAPGADLVDVAPLGLTGR